MRRVHQKSGFSLTERSIENEVEMNGCNNEIENVVILLIDIQTQQQIAALIEKSFALRHMSESLLQEAKVMVEREVEKSGAVVKQGLF